MNTLEDSTFIFKKIVPKENTNNKQVTNTLETPFFQVSLSPIKITRFLFSIILFLLIASLSFLFLEYFWEINSKSFFRINRLFDLDREGNIPTLFSSFQLLFASLILLFNYKTAHTKNGYWLFLSGIFLFLCIDETVQIHETLINLKPQVELFKKSTLEYVWVFPYLIMVVLLAIFLKRFIFSLPARTRNLMILSGFIFVGGAIGVEMIHDLLKVQNGGVENLPLKLLICLEETCEMTGVTIFIYALLDYITPNKSSITIVAGK